MNNQTESDSVGEHPLPAIQSRVFENRSEQTTEAAARSNPLKSTYNSIFIVLVLSIAAILAVILLVWPSGGF